MGNLLTSREILKIMYPRLAKIAFHGKSTVEIKCHLTIYLKHLINVAFFYKMRENFPSMCVSIGMYQVSMLRMSEKFVDPPKKVSKRSEDNFFGSSRGVWGPALQTILKIMYPRLVKSAFHGIPTVKIKCHLIIYPKY